MSLSGPRPDIDPEGRYNQADTARIFGVDRTTIRRWTLAGKLKSRMRRVPTISNFYLGRDLLALFDSEMGEKTKKRGSAGRHPSRRDAE